MKKSFAVRLQAVKNTKFRRMNHFVMSDFGDLGSRNYRAKDRIEVMTSSILDRVWEAWDIYCDSHNLGTPILQVVKGWHQYNIATRDDPYGLGCAVQLSPRNGKIEEFQEFCGYLLRGDKFIFDEVSRVEQGVEIIFMSAKNEQRKIVNIE